MVKLNIGASVQLLSLGVLLPMLFLGAYLGPPAQASAAGFKNLVADDEFSRSKVSSLANASVLYNWYPGVWWQGPPNPSQIRVSNGVLDLKWSRSSWLSNHLCQTTIQSESASGLIGHTFRYGYFEARMKWDNVKGAWPAFWMSPVQTIQGSPRFGEIDIFEGNGLDSHFYGTLHTWERTNLTWSSSSNQFPKWHTYGKLGGRKSHSGTGRYTGHLRSGRPFSIAHKSRA